MKKGYIILITENYRIPYVKNVLFLVTGERDDDVLLEDGTKTVGHIITGYVSTALPNGTVVVASPIELNFLTTDIKYKRLASCYYVIKPNIINTIPDDQEYNDFFVVVDQETI